MGYYHNRIIILANKFASKLREQDLFRGEFTSDLKEYFQAIHENLLILYKRVAESSLPEENKIPINNIISQLSKLLKADRFLRFDFDREYSIINSALSKIEQIKYHLHGISPNKIHYIMQVVNDLTHDLEQADSLFMSQNKILDRSIMVDPTRMTQNVNKDPDEFSYEDVSPDFPGFEN